MRLRTQFAAHAVVEVLHLRPAPARCSASGWSVKRGCACNGVAICPTCERPVSAKADPAHPGAVRLGGHHR